MKFKNEFDKEVVIRSLLLHSGGDRALAEEAVARSEFYIDAIKYILEKLDTKAWKNPPNDTSTKM